jgi:hypothetical protein
MTEYITPVNIDQTIGYTQPSGVVSRLMNNESIIIHWSQPLKKLNFYTITSINTWSLHLKGKQSFYFHIVIHLQKNIPDTYTEII